MGSQFGSKDRIKIFQVLIYTPGSVENGFVEQFLSRKSINSLVIAVILQRKIYIMVHCRTCTLAVGRLMMLPAKPSKRTCVLVFLLYLTSWKLSHRTTRRSTRVSTTFPEHSQMAYQCGRKQMHTCIQAQVINGSVHLLL